MPDVLSSTALCPICEGSGLRVTERPDGSRVASDCECRVRRRTERILTRTNIPKRYENSTLTSFETDHPTATRSLKRAYRSALKFVESYPLETRGTGLLLTGSVGVGKTHLAATILRALVTERGAEGVFYEYRDLLKKIQNSYNRNVQATELEVLAPIFQAEVLVLDELGASDPTEWVSDTVAHILNTRYNECRTTIVTTNYPNEPPRDMERDASAFAEARAANRKQTLGDRIGERMRSRLQEMCVVVEIEGADFRQTENRAHFG